MAIATGENAEASDFIGNPSPYLSFEATAGVTHSLTTVANQRVIVWVKGNVNGSGDRQWVRLKYNGVSKDLVQVDPEGGNNEIAFALMYTEIPGADTQDVTVEIEGDNGGGEGTGADATLQNVVIMVCKLLVG